MSLGYVAKEENIEEVYAPVPDVFSVLTDISLAHTWGRTQKGDLIYPQDTRMKLGHKVEVKPKGAKEFCSVKIRVIHHNEYVEMEIIDGPMFGNMKFQVEDRPYGTFLSAILDYRIERVGFRLKWQMSERKKYRQMMDLVLVNIKNFAEMKANQ